MIYEGWLTSLGEIDPSNMPPGKFSETYHSKHPALQFRQRTPGHKRPHPHDYPSIAEQWVGEYNRQVGANDRLNLVSAFSGELQSTNPPMRIIALLRQPKFKADGPLDRRGDFILFDAHGMEIGLVLCRFVHPHDPLSALYA